MTATTRGEDGIVVADAGRPDGEREHHERRSTATRWPRRVDRLVRRAGRRRAAWSSLSAKKTFFAGGDLKRMVQAGPEDAAAVSTMAEASRSSCAGSSCSAGRSSPRSTAPPWAAAWRSRSPATTGSWSTTRSVQLGLPEVTLGLLPGGGGVTRTVRMLGIADALMDVLLQGTRLKPRRGAGEGPGRRARRDPRELLPGREGRGSTRTRRPRGGAAALGPRRLQDARRHPVHPELAAFLPAFPAMLRKQLKGADYRRPQAILSAAVEGAQVDFDDRAPGSSRATSRA